jgi:hypothetical protein
VFTNLVIVLILIFFLCNFILFLFPLKKEEFFTNKERAEEYIYSKKKFSTVFVGSGLTGHLINTVYNGNVFNFFLPYSGACTGVEIVARSAKIPRVLLIETNFIFKGSDEELIRSLFTPINFWLKLFLPVLQKKHYLFSMLKLWVRSFKKEKITIEDDPQELDYVQLEMFRKMYSQSLDKKQFAGHMERLKKSVDEIATKNCMVIFFEMPLEESIANSLLASYQKKELKKMFPVDKYAWIEPDPLDTYYTKDGIHLVEESALRYSRYLSSRQSMIFC